MKYAIGYVAGFISANVLLTVLFVLRDPQSDLASCGNLQVTRDVIGMEPRFESFENTETRISNVRILCSILTQNTDANYQKAVAVNRTWAQRCNVYAFMTSWTAETRPGLPLVKLKVKEGRGFLTDKVFSAFKYHYQHHLNDSDWFVKADDDTYIHVDNLKRFLVDKNPNEPLFFGHYFSRRFSAKRPGFSLAYASGGAGYVLSREALRRLVKMGDWMCQLNGFGEDYKISYCLHDIGVVRGKSTDTQGKELFHCFQPETHLFGHYGQWYKDIDENGAKQGADNISDYPISFHYVPPGKMYELDFFFYKVKHTNTRR